jgi:hypothetical protein
MPTKPAKPTVKVKDVNTTKNPKGGMKKTSKTTTTT